MGLVGNPGKERLTPVKRGGGGGKREERNRKNGRESKDREQELEQSARSIKVGKRGLQGAR